MLKWQWHCWHGVILTCIATAIVLFCLPYAYLTFWLIWRVAYNIIFGI